MKKIDQQRELRMLSAMLRSDRYASIYSSCLELKPGEDADFWIDRISKKRVQYIERKIYEDRPDGAFVELSVEKREKGVSVTARCGYPPRKEELEVYASFSSLP